MTDTPSQEQAADEAVVEADPVTIVLDPADLGLDLPADEAEAQQALLGAVLVARQESGEYLETMQRVAAEFDNYRKRTDRDRLELVQRAAQRLITEMLPTLDSFDAALVYEPQTPSEDKILDGMRSTRTQLLDLLKAQGLEPIDSDGVTFDPAVHEAVSGPTAGGEGDLIVANELRRGYTLSGRVLRAALVTVEHGEGDSE